MRYNVKVVGSPAFVVEADSFTIVHQNFQESQGATVTFSCRLPNSAYVPPDRRHGIPEDLNDEPFDPNDWTQRQQTLLETTHLYINVEEVTLIRE